MVHTVDWTSLVLAKNIESFEPTLLRVHWVYEEEGRQPMQV
jgi:hypothetical protein